MSTPELFPEESRVREEAALAGWSETVGNVWALVCANPEDERLTLRVYPSFFEEGVTPAFLIVETLDGDPARAPVGLQLWVTAQGGRLPRPEVAKAVLGEHGVVCRVGEFMPEEALPFQGR